MPLYKSLETVHEYCWHKWGKYSENENKRCVTGIVGSEQEFLFHRLQQILHQDGYFEALISLIAKRLDLFTLIFLLP